VIRWQRAVELGILGVIGVGGGGWLAFKLALPAHVRRVCIEQAAAHGIGLDIDDVKVSLQSLTLIGLHANAPDVAGARASATEVDVTMSALQPQRLTIQGLELELTGPLGGVAEGLDRWRGGRGGGQTGSWPDSWTLDGAKVVWQGAAGEGVTARALESHLDVTWGARGTVVHARSENVTVATAGGVVFGPWRMDHDEAPGTSRTRIVLDPGVPDACTVLVLGDGVSIASVDVAIARAPLSRLGVPRQILDMANDVALTAGMHFSSSANGRADLTTKGGLFGIQVAGLARPVDVRWEGVATGNPRAGIDIRGAKLAVGPLVGDLRGTLKTFPSGFRVDLAWRADPVPCAALAMPVGSGEISEILYNLRKLGAPMSRLSGGTATASATLAFDSRDFGAFAVKLKPEVACRPLGPTAP
jgi:hypothetical protein